MATTKSHLRERLLSPDPIKSSIIRDSGLGWLSSPSSNNGGPSSQSSQDSDSANGSITSPLRIAKRTSSSSPRPLPQQPGQRLNRRSSNSYKHMATNNLVSKSPFKTAGFQPISTLPPKNTPIPFPVTRRVSGEKRPRPVSIHNQAENENDRPFALKRERRQSKSYQGLVNKTPVSKSPFRGHRTPSVEEPPVSEPPAHFSNVTTNSHAAPSPPPAPPTPPATAPPLEPPTPPNNSNGPSPGRSNLRSRRMHGPRVSNGYKRERRKTVTWDERMEVVEFDRDEIDDDEDLFDGGHPDNTSDCSPQEDDPFFHGSHAPENIHYDSNGHQDQFAEEDIHRANFSAQSGQTIHDMGMNTDDNISGLVDELFASSSMPPSMGDMHSPHQNEGYRDHNLHVEHEAQFLDAFDEHDGTEGGQDEEDQGVLARFRRHSRSPSLHHIQDFSPQPNAHSSPAGSRHHAGSPIPSSLVPSRPSSRQSGDSPRPSSSTGTPSRALPQTPSRFVQSSTPTSERSIHSQHASPQDYVAQLPASPSPRSSRRISNPDREEAYMSFEASYHSMQEQANTSSSSLHDELNHSGRNEENMSHGSIHEERQATIFIPDIPEASTEGPRPSTSRRSSAAEMGNQMNPAFQFPRRSQSPFHHSAGRPSDQHSPAVSRRQSEEHSVHDFSSRGTSPAPSSVNTSRISLDHAQDRPMDDDDDHKMDVQDDHSHSSHHHEFNKSFEGVAKIVELDQPVTAGKLDFDLGSNFENSISVDEWSPNCSGDELDNSGVGQDASMLDPSHASMKMGDVDVDMDMRSALDRLMDDVAGAHVTPYVQRRRTSSLPSPAPSHMERSATDSILYDELKAKPPMPPHSPPPPPAPPAKDNIKARERMILQKRRAARRQEEDDYDEDDEDAEYSRPARRKEIEDRQHLDVTRPSRRRSMSTGDVEAARKEEMLMEVAGVGLSDSIEKELQKLEEHPQQGKNKKYMIRERETIYASSSKPLSTKEEYDLADRAWKAIRRPSDMNEYAKQIREYRAQEKTTKAYGKVFVKVVGVKSLDVPLPNEPTALTCTLNNGIHFVTTPECELAPETRIEQEFELIEHSKLEFTLTLKIRRDPHIVQQFKDVLPTPPPRPVAPPPPVVQQSSSRGMRSFFSSSPKKSAKDKIVHQPPPPPPVQTPQRITNNLARYLKPDCTLARAFVSFKEIANRCDTRLFETTYPLIGQRVELGGKLSTCQVGEIVLQIFRLPPLPGIPPEQLPQSLDECLRGLRHINWHKVTYFEGTLTQLGGDCNTWRRRGFRVIGSSLIAFNDVTKRATATIDLKKAVGVEDNQDRENAAKSRSRDYSEHDDLFGVGVERSFRLLFPNDQIITFFADSDEEKARWLDVFRALIGHIPPHPLWGELLWQRQEEAAKAQVQEVPTTQPAPQPALQPTPQPTPQPIPRPAPHLTPQSTLTQNNTPQIQSSSPSWLVPRGAKR